MDAFHIWNLGKLSMDLKPWKEQNIVFPANIGP